MAVSIHQSLADAAAADAKKASLIETCAKRHQRTFLTRTWLSLLLTAAQQQPCNVPEFVELLFGKDLAESSPLPFDLEHVGQNASETTPVKVFPDHIGT